MATPRYANRKAKRLARPQAALQGNRTFVQQLAAARSFTMCAIAQDVSGLHGRTQQGQLCLSLASSSTTQVSRMAGYPVGVSPLVSSFDLARPLARSPIFLPSLFTFYFTTSTHSTPINLIHPFISIIYLSCGTDNSLAVCLSAKSFIRAQSTTTTAIVRELIPYEW